MLKLYDSMILSSLILGLFYDKILVDVEKTKGKKIHFQLKCSFSLCLFVGVLKNLLKS